MPRRYPLSELLYPDPADHTCVWDCAVEAEYEDAEERLDDADVVYELVTAGPDEDADDPKVAALAAAWLDFTAVGAVSHAVGVFHDLEGCLFGKGDFDAHMTEVVLARAAIVLSAHVHGAVDLRALAPLFLDVMRDAIEALGGAA